MFRGDLDQQLERINVYYNEATGGIYDISNYLSIYLLSIYLSIYIHIYLYLLSI